MISRSIDRLGVISGSCLVSRVGEGVLIVGGVGPDQTRVRDALLASLRDACAGAENPGDQLSRSLLRVIISEPPEAVPPFAAVAPGSQGLAMIMTPGMEAAWGDADEWHRVSGRQASSWLDHLISAPPARLILGVEPLSPVDPDPVCDLHVGVVPGDAAVLMWTSAEGSDSRPLSPDVAAPAGPPVEPSAASSAPAPVVLPDLPEPPTVPTQVEPPAPVPVRQPTRIASEYEIVSLRDSVETRAPLPVASDVSVDSIDSEHDHGGVEVQGLACVRNHFNHPNARFCAICGIDFNQQTRHLVRGTRPPLGVLVIDDGSAFTLDTDYVIGREPDSAAEVVSGAARALALADPDRSVSRIHAALSLAGWDVSVTDRGSANGTYLLPPDATDWVRLDQNQSAPLVPGARVAVGRRTFLFESHHVAE